MKKLVVLTAAIAMICGLGRTEAAGPPHAWDDHDVIGLIDMAEVFKKYKKFEALREDLKTEIAASEETIKSDVEALKALSAKLQMMTESSPGYAETESELASKAAEVDARRKVMQRDFLRKESQIYKQVYMEVQSTVEQYAKYYGYHVVLRFNRTALQETDDARGVINGMNRQVIYHRKKDDITDAVLQHLNTQYQKTVSTKGTSPN
ncbi:MAG: OmpH family outer membrane protein [Planctomycetaceae bacterium]|nr:OmpH family outer membrane protein [Planctomycetaceae bacterium]